MRGGSVGREAGVLSTEYRVLSTEYPVLSTEYPVLSTEYPVLSAKYPLLLATLLSLLLLSSIAAAPIVACAVPFKINSTFVIICFLILQQNICSV